MDIYRYIGCESFFKCVFRNFKCFRYSFLFLFIYCGRIVSKDTYVFNEKKIIELLRIYREEI